MLGLLPQRYPNLSVTAQQRVRALHPSRLAVSALTAFLLFALAAVALPGDVLGATVVKITPCGANLRTTATVGARPRAVVATSTGKTATGRTWYRISAVNGKSVRSLYGVTYVYAASSLFKTMTPVPVVRYAACEAYLRTGPAKTTSAKSIIATNAKVLVARGVTGAAWSTTCAGKTVAGTGWFQVTRVNDVPVQTLYGVPVVYAALGLFKTAVAPVVTPTPTPSASEVPASVPTRPCPACCWMPRCPCSSLPSSECARRMAHAAASWSWPIICAMPG